MSALDNAAEAMEQRCRALALDLRLPDSSSVACKSHAKMSEGVSTLLECQANSLAKERTTKGAFFGTIRSEAVKIVITAALAAIVAIFGVKANMSNLSKNIAAQEKEQHHKDAAQAARDQDQQQ